MPPPNRGTFQGAAKYVDVATLLTESAKDKKRWAAYANHWYEFARAADKHLVAIMQKLDMAAYRLYNNQKIEQGGPSKQLTGQGTHSKDIARAPIRQILHGAAVPDTKKFDDYRQRLTLAFHAFGCVCVFQTGVSSLHSNSE